MSDGRYLNSNQTGKELKMRIEHRILKSFGLILGLLLAGGLGAVAGEMEINLVRNPTFRPGMDKQGPADWSPAYYMPRANIYEAGRGDATFTKNGMILKGSADLFQFDRWDQCNADVRAIFRC